MKLFWQLFLNYFAWGPRQPVGTWDMALRASSIQRPYSGPLVAYWPGPLG